MHLDIYATGRSFAETAAFKSVLDLLGNYEIAFDKCLRRSCIANNASMANVQVRVSAIEHGSLDVHLLVEVAAAIMPLAPQIYGYAWDLFKSAYDLIMIANQYFMERRRPIIINQTESPNAVVVIIQDNRIETTSDVMKMASSIHPYLEKIAKLIQTRKADRIEMGVDHDDRQREQIEFNRDNRDKFKVLEQDFDETTPVEFECDIYRFNKKSLKGYLEFQDQEQPQLRPFTIDRSLQTNCIDAIKAARTRVTAYRKMATNSLGETKIKEFHIIGIAIQ